MVSNDIALIKLIRPINFQVFSGYVAPACLPIANSTAAGIITVTGFGSTTSGGTASEMLRAVELPIVSLDVCRKIYGKEIIPSTVLCAGYREGGKDSCQGDSGGPMIKMQNGVATVVGIVSWGYGCALEVSLVRFSNEHWV